MKYSFENKNPLWHIHEGFVPKTNQIVVDDEIIQIYPDNDGGMWFWDKNGKKVVMDVAGT